MDIKAKGKGFWLNVIGALLAVVATVFAAITTANDGAADVAIIVLSVIAIVGVAVTVFVDYEGFGKIIVAFLYFCCLGLFVSSQLGNLGYALAGIQDIGNGVQPGFVIGAILYLGSTVLACIAAFDENNK